MEKVIIFFLIFYLLLFFTSVLRLFLNLNTLDNLEMSEGENTKIIILLPIHRELHIVEEAIIYYHKNFIECFNNIEIYVVAGSSNENKVFETREIVKSTLRSLEADRIKLIVEDNENSTKVSKLNSVLYSGNNGETSNVIWGVYDIDSRPDNRVISELLCLNRFDNEMFFQQVPHVIGSLLNAKEISSLVKMISLCHLERSVLIETFLDSIKYPYLLSWLGGIRGAMGAGMFFNDKLRNRIISIPEVNDDISLGYRLDIMNVSRTTLKSINIVQPVNSVEDYRRQLMAIFIGVFSFFRELNTLKLKEEISIFKALEFTCLRVVQYLKSEMHFVKLISLFGLVFLGCYREALIFVILISILYFLLIKIFNKHLIGRKEKALEIKCWNYFGGSIIGSAIHTYFLFLYLKNNFISWRKIWT